MKKATRRATPAKNKSWRPGQKGQGGEGMSKGYGGSAGKGTGPSGPDTDQPHRATLKKRKLPSHAHSDCLPSRETIAKVLR